MTPTERAIVRAGLDYEIADTLGDLRDTRRDIAGITDELRRLRDRRDQLITRAVTLGAPREAVAEAAGVSRQQVHAIAQRPAAD